MTQAAGISVHGQRLGAAESSVRPHAPTVYEDGLVREFAAPGLTE